MRRARLPEALVLNAARETVTLFHEHWRKEKKNLPMHKDVIAAIETQIKKIPLA